MSLAVFLAFLARMLLTTLFGFAGIAKLLDLKGSRKAMTDFGVPEWLAAPLGYCLPVIEIAVACLLALARATVWGAWEPSYFSSPLLLESPSTWRAVIDQTVTASASCTPSQ